MCGKFRRTYTLHTENSDDHRRMDEEEERGREEREKKWILQVRIEKWREKVQEMSLNLVGALFLIIEVYFERCLYF